MKNLAAWAAWGGDTLHFLSFLVPPFLSLPSFHPSFLTPSRLPSLPLPFPSTPSANVVLCSFRRSITLPFTAFCIIFSDSAPPPPPPILSADHALQGRPPPDVAWAVPQREQLPVVADPDAPHAALVVAVSCVFRGYAEQKISFSNTHFSRFKQNSLVRDFSTRKFISLVAQVHEKSGIQRVNIPSKVPGSE